MSDPKPLCVAHIELGAHLYGGAQQVLYLLGELSKTEVRSIEETPDWPVSLKDLLRETELDWLQRALAACDQRQNEAAKLLGLSYDQMRALMRKHHQTTRPGRQKKQQK